MNISVASSIGDIDDDVTEFGAAVVVVLRGTLGRLDVFDGATVVMRFWEELLYVTHCIIHWPMALWGY